MQLTLFQVDAFTDRVFRGNPAAVCPLTTWLDDATMQNIALENNLSETAFFVANSNGFDLRWFTPVSEVDLCGHATLACAHVIFKHLNYPHPDIIFSTKSGSLTVSRTGDLLQMNFPSQPGNHFDTHDELIEILNIRPLDVVRAEDWFIVLENEATVKHFHADMNRLRSLDLRGVCITAQGNDCDFVSRFFAPKFGVDEDPVTGSAHCTLTPYWADRLNKKQLHARQISARGGEIFCELIDDRVILSGYCADYLQGEITL